MLELKAMKECPVCREVFTDEFKFCDLDGARLRRKPGSDSSRWSNVGALLLLAAIIFSVWFIFFFPKGSGAPALTPSGQTERMATAQSKTDVAQQEKTEAALPEPKLTPPAEKSDAEPAPLEPISPPQPLPKPPQPEKGDKRSGLYKAFKQIYGDN
jgi:hypothetical protein